MAQHGRPYLTKPYIVFKPFYRNNAMISSTCYLNSYSQIRSEQNRGIPKLLCGVAQLVSEAHEALQGEYGIDYAECE